MRQKAPAFRPSALLLALLVLGLALSTTGCGNRGPLYLPDSAEPVTAPDPTNGEDANADEEDEDDEDASRGD